MAEMYRKNHVEEFFYDDGSVVLFDPISCSTALIPTNISSDYKEMSNKGQYDINNKYLADTFFTNEDDSQYADELVYNLQKKVVNSEYLHLTIMPTEQCNFRCVYCYETYQKGKMSKETADSIVLFVESEIDKHKGLYVSWFGGEPTLALDLVVYLSDRLLTLCKHARKPYLADMTTNGYNLSMDVVNKLYRYRVFNYQITLDGVKKIHDKQRVMCNGEGTFDVIVSNLSRIMNEFQRKFFSITIRTNITVDMLDSIEEFTEFLKKMFTNSSIVNFRFRIAWGIGDRFIKDKVAAYRKVFSCFDSTDSNYFRSELGELSVGGGVCYAAQKNSYVVGADGTVYKCTVHFDDATNNIGYINKLGEMILDKDKLEFWTERIEIEDECKECPSRISCLGIGCPYNRYSEHTCNAVSEQCLDIVHLIAKSGIKIEKL